jgi:hypothetical protein
MASLARSAPILAAFAWATLGLQAQEVTFQATTDRNAITVGDPVRFTLELTNASGRITTPDWGGLAVLQGPSTSSNFSSVNGRVSRSSSTSWVLTATSPGDFTIGPSTASVGGGTLRSEPVHIHVTKAAAGAASSPQAAQGQKKDPNLFCTITLSKQKAWVGEQVIATYTLFSRYSSLQPGDYDLPKVSGFWAEEVDLGETNWEPGQRTVNGLRYNVAVLKKQVLIPLRGGSLRVEPMTLNYRVNPSFFNSGTPVRIQSNAVTLVAMELPPGKPADFMGAVGDIRLDVEAKGPAVKANEAVDLTIRFTGKANLKLIDAPQLSLPGDFEAFDPKIEDKITVNGAGMSGSRTFQYLLIPRHEGDYDIGALSFSYFDPASGSYKSLRSAPLRFQVARAMPMPMPPFPLRPRPRCIIWAVRSATSAPATWACATRTVTSSVPLPTWPACCFRPPCWCCFSFGAASGKGNWAMPLAFAAKPPTKWRSNASPWHTPHWTAGTARPSTTRSARPWRDMPRTNSTWAWPK